jgi:toxin HigB-1
MIKSFADKETEKVFHREFSWKLPVEIQGTAKKKLDMIHAAELLIDLRIPPGNHLEELRGNREGQHSIRINENWRICFYWIDCDACDVEITDYH